MRSAQATGIVERGGPEPVSVLREPSARPICRQFQRTGSDQRGASLDASGYDAGKKVLGRKRHVLTDTLELLLAVVVHPASMQNRDGARAPHHHGARAAETERPDSAPRGPWPAGRFRFFA
jgi:hypothetical protein